MKNSRAKQSGRGALFLGLGTYCALILAGQAATEAIADPVLQGAQEALEVLRANHIEYVPESTRHQAMEAIFRSVDPHSRILDREAAQLKEAREMGMCNHLGLSITVSNGVPRVTEIHPGSPAIEEELEVGDEIIEVDGVNVTDRDVVSVARLLHGDKAGPVSLRVRSAEGREPLGILMERQSLRIPALAETREFPNEIVYARLNGLFAGTGEEVVKRLRGWFDAGKSGAVLDLRGAGGSDLDSADMLAGLVGEPRSFLYSLRDTEDQELRVQRAEPGPALGMPLVVLVDGETKRASELLAAALKGSGRGVILVGRTTSGDPEVRERIRLSEEEWVYLAVRKLVVGDGTQYTGADGVEPHIVVAHDAPAYTEITRPITLFTDRRQTTEEEVRMERLREQTRGDAVLTRAVDILLGLRALNFHSYGRPPSS